MKTRIEKLEKIIEISRQQRRLLIYEDLTPFFDLQQARELLFEGLSLESLGQQGEYEKNLVDQILKMDREIIGLLSIKREEVKAQIGELQPFKKMLRSRRGTQKAASNKISCRV